MYRMFRDMGGRTHADISSGSVKRGCRIGRPVFLDGNSRRAR
jgi:hypothetical protein